MSHLPEYAVHHWPYVAALLAMLVLAAVTEFRHATRMQRAVSPADAVALVNAGALVLDLRTQEAFEAGHLANARLTAGSMIADGAAPIAKWKGKPVLAYCENGVVSGAAARQLGRLGFTHAVNLRGGLAAWRQESLPLVKG